MGNLERDQGYIRLKEKKREQIYEGYARIETGWSILKEKKIEKVQEIHWHTWRLWTKVRMMENNDK